MEREGPGVILTPGGESYAREVRKALQTLSDARVRSADAALSGDPESCMRWRWTR